MAVGASFFLFFFNKIPFFFFFSYSTSFCCGMTLFLMIVIAATKMLEEVNKQHPQWNVSARKLTRLLRSHGLALPRSLTLSLFITLIIMIDSDDSDDSDDCDCVLIARCKPRKMRPPKISSCNQRSSK